MLKVLSLATRCPPALTEMLPCRLKVKLVPLAVRVPPSAIG